ncbi:MAG TPA: sialidase family protein [Rariglobus sp.]|nr:sialidase family protein [Rariglobus sp.]
MDFLNPGFRIMGSMFLGSLLCHAGGASPSDPFRIENQIILTSMVPGLHFLPARAALIPESPARVLLTIQQMDTSGTHGFRDLYSSETKDNGRTWSPPERIETLRRTTLADGYDLVVGDLYPQWHVATGVVLATGKTFGFRDGTKEDRSRERVSYSVYTPATRAWSGLQMLDLPISDHEGKPLLEANAGCNQRFDLVNGDVLLPIRYRKDAGAPAYTTIVARCSFDGKTLTYRTHGTELTLPRDRGFYEPSVTGFDGRYYLTLRADHSAYVTRSEDGLDYEPAREWTFDDGAPLGSYNTQQHWVTHGRELYLVYTRRGANNDHVFRNRAPLFIARVDPVRLCVLRSTERVLIPERGLGLGNFGIVVVSPKETWVITAEEAFPANRRHEPNHVLLARILWTKSL